MGVYEIKVYTREWVLLKVAHVYGQDRQDAEWKAEKARDELEPSGHYKWERIR